MFDSLLSNVNQCTLNIIGSILNEKDDMCFFKFDKALMLLHKHFNLHELVDFNVSGITCELIGEPTEEQKTHFTYSVNWINGLCERYEARIHPLYGTADDDTIHNEIVNLFPERIVNMFHFVLLGIIDIYKQRDSLKCVIPFYYATVENGKLLGMSSTSQWMKSYIKCVNEGIDELTGELHDFPTINDKPKDSQFNLLRELLEMKIKKNE